MLRRMLYSVLVCMLFSSPAFAYKECLVQTTKIYTGGGLLWMTFKNGGHAYVEANNVNYKDIYSMVLAAQLANKKLSVRFLADDAVCNSGTRKDVQGVWLHSD